MQFSNYFLLFLLTAILSSCVTNKTYVEKFNPNHPEISKENLKQADINIDSVFYQGCSANPKSYKVFESPEKANDEMFDFLDEPDYFATFSKNRDDESGNKKYYFNIDKNKNSFVLKALETMLESDLNNSDKIDVQVNILEHKVDEDIYMFQACYYQTLEMEFHYTVHNKQFHFVAESVDSLTLPHADLSQINKLAYKGVYKCAKQFVEYHISQDYDQYSTSALAVKRKADFKRRFNKRIQYNRHPSFKFGLTQFAGSSGLAFGYTSSPKEKGRYTNSFSSRLTFENFSFGYTPVVYYEENRIGQYLFLSFDFIMFFEKESENRDTSDAAYSISLGIGDRFDKIDLKAGGSLIFDNEYDNNKAQFYLYLEAAYYF